MAKDFKESEHPRDGDGKFTVKEKGRDEAEPVIFWKYTGKNTEYKNSIDFTNNVKPSESYDVAKNIRDKEMEK